MSSISDAELAACVEDLLGTQDLASTTVKQLLALAEQRLGLQKGELRQRKAVVKAAIADYAVSAQEQQKRQEEEEGDEDEPASRARAAQKPKARAKPKSAPKKQEKVVESKEEYALGQLRKLAKAARKGPALFKGLPSLPVHEQVAVLRQRLHELDLTFSDVPTDQEIKRVEKERQLELDMDGIDTSLIINGGRRSRRSTTTVAHQFSSADEDEDGESNDSDSDSASEASDVEDDNEERKSPPKRRKANSTNTTTSSKRARKISDSEEEAEFEL